MDKLKKQIKEAKLAKKALKSGGGLSTAPPSSALINDDVDELLVVKSILRPGDEEERSEEDAADETNLTIEPLDKADSRKTKKVLKIKRDGTGKASAGAASKKVLFDDDGEAAPGMQLVPVDKREVGDKVRDAEEHARRVKARIDDGRAEDNLRDKERIQNKHRERRLRDKSDKAEVQGAAVLSNAVEEVYDENDDSGDDEDEDEADYGSDDDVRGGESGSDDMDMDVSFAEQQALRMMG